MPQRLFANASTNLIGYMIIAILNLALTGMIIRVWGLNGYGVFILIRLITPLGYFNILDFGMLESTVRNIAKYRSSSKEINQVFLLSLFFIICTGALISLSLFFFGKHLLFLLGITEASALSSSSIESLIVPLAIMQIPLFIMLFLESVVKGYEKFLWLRLIDVSFVSACIVSLFILPENNMHLIDFIYVYYTFLNIKLVVLAFCIVYLDYKILRFTLPSVVVTREVLKHGLTLGSGKIISTTIENIPVIMLSSLATIELVGAYDALMRIPRFIKAIMGAITSVMVPYVSSLSSLEFHASKSRLIILATKYQNIIFAPILMFGVVYSDQLLSFWLGSEYVSYGNIMKLCFIVPILILAIGVPSSVSVVDQQILKILNYINLLRLAIYSALLYLLLQYFMLEAFILANIISYALTMVLSLTVFRRYFCFSVSNLLISLFWTIIISGFISYIGLNFTLWVEINNPVLGFTLGGAFLLVTWMVLYVFILSRTDKQQILSR